MHWYGDIGEFIRDKTRMIDLEGAFRSGKTTAALWKVLSSCLDYPGIHWLICRYADGDTQTKLKPKWREVLDQCGVVPKWDPRELCDILPNGSKVYIFGVKAADQVARYGKLRGLTLAGIYNDQTEELPKDIFQEFLGRMSQPGFPHQILLTPNPPEETHWLATEFPEDNRRKDRRYYAVPIHVNAHNLSPETIRNLEEAYPPAHPKHRSAVLGKRGLNVVGEPVYKGAFVRAIHEGPVAFDPALPLDEAIDFGKHHPCVVWRQGTVYGGVALLGGVMGQGIFLEDFVPIVLEHRARWFPEAREVRSCCDPAGAHNNSQGVRENGVAVLRRMGVVVRYREDSNAPDVRLAMVERMAGLMRRRTASGAEAFRVSKDRWVRVSSEGVVPWTFLADGFEAGYVWDEHLVSVGNKAIRRPKKDGWYEHGQNCAEYLELNFRAAVGTDPGAVAIRKAQRARVGRIQLGKPGLEWMT
jgi:hypothetical protein